MSEPLCWVYLDHNILDLMVKGQLESVRSHLERSSWVPVFSNENLAEIRRSSGYENDFLELLRKLGARHLVSELNEKFRHTGDATLRVVDPAEAYADYLDATDSFPNIELSLTGMLEKFYGGRSDQTFRQIAQQQTDELNNLVEKIRDEVASIPDFYASDALYSIGKIDFEILNHYEGVATELDGKPEAIVRQFEQAMGVGPKQLNNIKPPGVLQQIWGLLEPRIPDCEMDMDLFFGVRPHSFDTEPDRARTALEKVNAIYHQLNFVGYFRDSKMQKKARFTASTSDMTHAGLATFCHILLTSDSAMARKAAAAYEYLGVGTRVLVLEQGIRGA